MQPLHSRPNLSILAVALCAFGLCALGFCAIGAGNANAAGRYVAFGDSGTAGAGLGAQYPGSRTPCAQTSNSYPVYVAKALNITDFALAACSSAWINDLTTTQDPFYNNTTHMYETPPPPQFDTLNGTETLVSISIGDNDAGFGDITSSCTGNTTSATRCHDSTPFNDFVQRANVLTSTPLGEAIDEAHRRAPNAEIWVIGYPRLLPQDASNCPGKIDISASDAVTVNAWQRAINDTERQTAAAHGAFYLDVFSASTGHDPCQSNPADRWVNPQQSATPGTAWEFHPTVAGHSAVATMFANAWKSPRQVGNAPVTPTLSVKPVTPTLSLKLRARKMHAVRSRKAPITKTAPKKHGARLRVTLTNRGKVKFFIERARKGHVRNGKCRSLSKRASKGRKSCSRYSVVSSPRLTLPTGASTVYFTGRAKGKRLPEGKYRLRAVFGALSAGTRTVSLAH